MAAPPKDKGKNAFDWKLHEAAEDHLQELLGRFMAHHAPTAVLAERMESETSTRLFDWVDHIALPETDVNLDALAGLGFHEVEGAKVPDGARLLRVPGSTLFPLLVRAGGPTELVLHVEQIEAFQAVHAWNKEVLGGPWASARWLEVAARSDRRLVALERRGHCGFVFDAPQEDDAHTYAKAFRSLVVRKREFFGDEEGFHATEDLLRRILKDLPPSRAADAFFRAERRYYESRNDVGRLQRERQDHLGMGWGNNDHHTFRCSREHFRDTLMLLELLGMTTRERFYAGAEAGWGAQVLEHPGCGAVVFADVDLLPEERGTNFSTGALGALERPGTIGLWVALHGESMLQSGLHHMAARVDYKRFKADMAAKGHGMMAPFSDFPFLVQSFSEPQRWHVDAARAAVVEDQGLVDEARLNEFREHGAIAGHFEAIERNQGFKGFNQDSVSVIIRATDPRSHRGGMG